MSSTSNNSSKILKSSFERILALYRKEVQARDDHQYRIVEFIEHNTVAIFQVVGKGILLKMPVRDLMRGDLLLGFRRADIAMLAHLGTQQELERKQSQASPRFLARIAHQLFGKGGKTKFMLKMPEQEQLVEAVPEEVMTNKEVLNMLEGHEAAMIGYAAAENRMAEMRTHTHTIPTCRVLSHDLVANVVTYLDEEREAKHTLPLTDIFYNKKLLNLFTQLDQQMISFVAGEAHQRKMNPHPPISFQLISYAKEMAEYQDETGKVHTLSFLELAFDPELLNQFSQKDRDMIRFVAGELSKEKEMVIRSKEKN